MILCIWKINNLGKEGGYIMGAWQSVTRVVHYFFVMLYNVNHKIWGCLGVSHTLDLPTLFITVSVVESSCKGRNQSEVRIKQLFQRDIRWLEQVPKRDKLKIDKDNETGNCAQVTSWQQNKNSRLCRHFDLLVFHNFINMTLLPWLWFSLHLFSWGSRDRISQATDIGIPTVWKQ